MLFMPTGNVYVYYLSGRKENVAIQDSLSSSDANWFYNQWNKADDPIVKITLVDRYHNILKEYKY